MQQKTRSDTPIIRCAERAILGEVPDFPALDSWRDYVAKPRVYSIGVILA